MAPRKKPICPPEILLGKVEQTGNKWILTADLNGETGSVNVTVIDDSVKIKGKFREDSRSAWVHFTQEHEIPAGYSLMSHEKSEGRVVVVAMRQEINEECTGCFKNKCARKGAEGCIGGCTRRRDRECVREDYEVDTGTEECTEEETVTECDYECEYECESQSQTESSECSTTPLKKKCHR